MNNFIQVQIYCSGNSCCFDDIKRSNKPFITININEIVSLGQREDWGFCDEHWKYPYRILTMSNGDKYLLVVDSANELEEKLLYDL